MECRLDLGFHPFLGNLCSEQTEQPYTEVPDEERWGVGSLKGKEKQKETETPGKNHSWL